MYLSRFSTIYAFFYSELISQYEYILYCILKLYHICRVLIKLRLLVMKYFSFRWCHPGAALWPGHSRIKKLFGNVLDVLLFFT
jgi:hypothetical protein